MQKNTYSKRQREAIEYGSGPLMVLAGPGSGKTFVITHRIRFLIESLGISPDHILVVTFSKAAAVEMEERFLKLTGEARGRVTFGTFHSVFFRIIRTAYGYAGDQVASEEERATILRGLLKDSTEEKENESFVQEVLAEIASVKENRVDLTYYYAQSCSAEVFRQLYIAYEKEMGERKKIDFEDMLLMTYDLLVEREDIRRALEQRFRYILVDEFQDINHLQYEIVKLIAGQEANLTIVGDDDQSIYRFRGSKPEIMLGFSKDYPKVHTVVLDLNFRSTDQIVAASKRLIVHNQNRFVKEIRAFRGAGPKVEIVRFSSPRLENKSIIEDLRDFQSRGLELDDIAILYRTNIQPRILVEQLMEHNIPFVMKDVLPDIFEHWIAKDILSYLRLAVGIGERRDLLRIINRPNRYIKRESLQYSDGSLKGVYGYYHDKPYMQERILDLENSIRAMQTLKPATAIRMIKNTINYDAFLENYAEEYSIDEDELFEILHELEGSASAFLTISEWFSHIEEYRKILEEKRKERRTANDADLHGVRLMTFHSSKGLEYRVVYIIGANNGIIPHKKAKTAQELEEERRMFYVAMTRAKDRLFIFGSESGFHKKSEMSDFVKEVMTADQLSKGMKGNRI